MQCSAPISRHANETPNFLAFKALKIHTPGAPISAENDRVHLPYG